MGRKLAQTVDQVDFNISCQDRIIANYLFHFAAYILNRYPVCQFPECRDFSISLFTGKIFFLYFAYKIRIAKDGRAGDFF